MARKRLIKGANAVRVEDRIARIPADLDPSGGIFGALKALEEATDHPAPATRSGKAAPARAGAVLDASGKPRRLGPGDFSAAERAAIVRCCADYRNRLPIYLMAVQREVAVIDSVIAKCAAEEGKGSVGRP